MPCQLLPNKDRFEHKALGFAKHFGRAVTRLGARRNWRDTLLDGLGAPSYFRRPIRYGFARHPRPRSRTRQVRPTFETGC